MVDSIGTGGGLARAAIEAALRRHNESLARLSQAGNEGVAPTAGGNFAEKLIDGIRQIDTGVTKSEQLPMEMLKGNVTDFHEVVTQLKQSELSFKYALQVRNKLIDAYREVMRMSV